MMKVRNCYKILMRQRGMNRESKRKTNANFISDRGELFLYGNSTWADADDSADSGRRRGTCIAKSSAV